MSKRRKKLKAKRRFENKLVSDLAKFGILIDFQDGKGYRTDKPAQSESYELSKLKRLKQERS